MKYEMPWSSDSQFFLPFALSKVQFKALAGVAQWIKRCSENQRVSGLIPSLGRMPGLRAKSPFGGM